MAQRRAAWDAAHNREIEALHALVRDGTELIYVPGNHDRPIRRFCGLMLPAMQVRRRRSTERLDDNISGTIADAADDPETAVDKNQMRSILFNCLSKLSAAHREVVDLVYYHQRTIDEVAAITGVERNTVKTRMFYARKKLGEHLKQQGFDRGWP